jgi:hypothetical protein
MSFYVLSTQVRTQPFVWVFTQQPLQKVFALAAHCGARWKHKFGSLDVLERSVTMRTTKWRLPIDHFIE